MEKDIKKLILAFFIISILKILLGYFVKSPSSFADDYYYMLSAKSFISLDFNTFFAFYPPLYPLVISWTFLFNDSTISYLLIKLTNSLISSLIIFPAYLLSKEFLKNEKTSFYSAIIIALLPSNFAYSSFVMSENIFNFLFLMTIYTLYIGFKKEPWLLILSSFFMVLCYATRAMGVAIFLVAMSFALIEKKYKEGLFILISSIIFLTIYFTIKGSVSSGYEDYDITINITEILFWLILYPSFLYLQGFIVFTNSAVKSIKNNAITRLFIISIFFILGLATFHAIAGKLSLFYEISGRPMGRYTAAIMPLIIIMGIKGIKKFKISYFWALPFSILMLYPMLPPNNIDVTWLGVFTYFIRNQSFFVQFVINLAIISFVILLLNYTRRYINLKRIILVLFLLNLVIFGIIAYNANTHYFERDDAKAGRYLNKIDPNAKIVVDENGCTERFTKESATLCDVSGPEMYRLSLIGLWNKNVVVSDEYEGADYFVSKKELNLKKIKQFGEVIIYEV